MQTEEKVIKQNIIAKNNFYAWFVTLIGSLFFLYAFFQCNLMTPLQHSLMSFFNVDTAVIGLISACFFYGNVAFLIPAGLILDRYPVRYVMLGGMVLAISGSVIFAFSTNVFSASIGRFLSGMMMSFGLITCIKLASLWLSSNKMALASSIIVTIGMLGGLASQTPMTILTKTYGWQHAVFIIALLGVVVGFILFIFVKDPKTHLNPSKKEKVSIKACLSEVLKNPQNWFAGFFTCLLNFPISIFGALFGITYIMGVYQFSAVEASSIVSMLFVGMIFGAPFFGWFSDKIGSRKTPMLIGSFLCLIFVSILIVFTHFSMSFLYALFFIVGFTSGAQVLGYTIVSESNPFSISGTALSFAAMIIMGVGYGLALPFVGLLLKIFSNNEMQLNLTTFRMAFSTLPIAIFISFILALLTKETHPKKKAITT